MNISEKIKKDHTRIAKQLRQYKKKMKNRIPISKLNEILQQEKSVRVDYRDYGSYYGIDDNAYSKAVGKQEARIELLEELIRKYS